MRIYPETFQFLKDLAANNNRDWFMAHKKDHDKAKENVTQFAGELIKELSKVDPTLDPGLDPAKCVLRIYRDIRFSADKTPYKNNFGIGKLTSGKNVMHIGYYMHVQPGESFIAGGSWMPENDQLKKIRQEIDYNAGSLKKVVDAPEFVKLFGNFRNQEMSLKTVPQGYSSDNENIDLLRLRNFVALHNFTDKELQQEGIVKEIASICGRIYPLNEFLKNAVS
jgi:uncharacterized protein (TIGR02453 family)